MTNPDYEAMIAHRDTVDAQIARSVNRSKYSIDIPEKKGN